MNIIALVLFVVFFSPKVLAMDCTQMDITLGTQTEVDDFQSNYGPCDRIAGDLHIAGETISNLEGLSSITNVEGNLTTYSTGLTNFDGLQLLDRVGGHVSIDYNFTLLNIDALSSLVQIDGGVAIRGNQQLKDLDGLSGVTHLGANLIVRLNPVLDDVDGLSGLIGIDGGLFIESNERLHACDSLIRLIDDEDDAELGPGPGLGNVPDIGGEASFQFNGVGCNSIRQILLGITSFKINPGMNDAWFDPTTPGQGFLISVFPDVQTVFLAWFTFDTERPPADVKAYLGDAGHRWLTAQGPYDAQTAHLDVVLTAGGVFDNANPEPQTSEPIGFIDIEFDDCENALLYYDIDSPKVSGTIGIKRIALDNVALCELLSTE